MQRALALAIVASRAAAAGAAGDRLPVAEALLSRQWKAQWIACGEAPALPTGVEGDRRARSRAP
jgi:hypothetical protein